MYPDKPAANPLENLDEADAMVLLENVHGVHSKFYKLFLRKVPYDAGTDTETVYAWEKTGEYKWELWARYGVIGKPGKLVKKRSFFRKNHAYHHMGRMAVDKMSNSGYENVYTRGIDTSSGWYWRPIDDTDS
jgi:hypothetical protein